MTPIETERKFLIYMPDISRLSEFDGVRIKHIEQTYLVCENGKKARVRRIAESGKVSFVKTVKQRISALSCFEDEREITREEYESELKNADADKSVLFKTRYCIPYENHVVEIDVYPFWGDRALLEVELSSESEEFSIPEFVKIIKEVSEDSRYKNTNIAKIIPFDAI